MNHFLSQLIDTTISSFIEDISIELAITQRVPKSWELIHRYGDYGKALALSYLTNSSTDIHLQFTPGVQKIIHKALQSFNTREVAAKLALVEPKVLNTWIRLGELGFQPYYQFMLEVNRSEAMAEAADNEAISRGNGHLKLERLKLRSNAWKETPNNTSVNINNHTEITQNNVPLLSLKEDDRKRIIEEMLLGIDVIDHE